MSPVAVAGMLATVVAFTDSAGCEWILFPVEMTPTNLSVLAVILDKSHWMLYFIVMAMYPVSFSWLFERKDMQLTYNRSQRFLITFDEEGNLLPVTVRVGQVSYVPAHPLIPFLIIILPFKGRRCRWTSRKAKNDLGFPDSFDTCKTWTNGTSRTSYRRIHVLFACAGRM